MIGNFSFEEHVKYFNGMYNHLKSIDRSLDDATIINVIKSKVMIEQELENIMHNLNIKNISDTPMVKDFKIWSAKYEVQSNEDEDESEAQSSEAQSEDEDESEDESEAQSEAQSSEAQSEDEDESEDEDSETANGEDENDYSGVEEFRRHYRNSETQRHNYIPNISNIPEGY